MATNDQVRAQERAVLREKVVGRASLRGIRMSARKVRIVADFLRGEPIGKALTTLAFQRRAAALPLRKVLDSAVANASERGADVDTLVVAEIQVNKGPIQKRFMPRAHGRASPIRKQTTHIEVVLESAI